MRGEQESAHREWHEKRVISITLFGEPDCKKPREVTLLDPPRGTQGVGLQRPVLATLSFAQMPTLQGPQSDRVQSVLQVA